MDSLALAQRDRTEAPWRLPSEPLAVACAAGFRALGEPVRLRLLAALLDGDVPVSDLVEALALPQPTISRHLRTLTEVGLVERHREGSWMFYRTDPQALGRLGVLPVLRALGRHDPGIRLDLERLEAARSRRDAAAASYFQENADAWDSIRALHADDAMVEAALRDLLGERAVETLVDLGTGTGRMLVLFADCYAQGLGIDRSPGMLAVARARLQAAGVAHASLRQGDMTRVAQPDASADVVVMHQVLHYAAHPGAVLREAARLLRPGGVLLLADLAPHEEESLRAEHHHLHLGFAEVQVRAWAVEAGAQVTAYRAVAGGRLTVGLWRMERRPTPSKETQA